MANTLTLTEHLAIKTYHRQQQLQQQQHHRARKQTPALQQTSPLCEQRFLDSAVDIIILLLVLGACGFLFTPYFTYVCGEVAEVLPATYLMIWEVVYQAPVAYAGAAVTMFVAVISVYEIYQYKARRCENPKCRGLRKAMELDIQLETEQCVKASALMAEKMPRNGGLDLGQDQKELEAELRRMAPQMVELCSFSEPPVDAQLPTSRLGAPRKPFADPKGEFLNWWLWERKIARYVRYM